METGCCYTDGEKASFYSNQRRFINLIHRLAEKYPGQVEILNEPETNDGTIYCQIPQEWFCIRPKRVIELTEEEREKRRQRFIDSVSR